MTRRLSNAEDWRFEVAQGRITGHYYTEKFGRNPEIDTGAEEDIYSYGGNFHYPVVPTQIFVRSSSAADQGGSPLGTGCWEVTVLGLDGDYNPQTDTFVLDGVNHVEGSTSPLKTWLRVYRVKCGACGSGGTNAGDIHVIDDAVSSPGNMLGHIVAGEGQSEQAQFTVRAGHTAQIIMGETSLRETSQGALKETSSLTQVWIRDYNESSTDNYNCWRKVESIDLNNRGKGQASFGPISQISEKADIRVSAIVGANDTQVDASFQIVEVRNSL